MNGFLLIQLIHQALEGGGKGDANYNRLGQLGPSLKEAVLRET